jgi:predicted nuclease with TOPRIM domain
MGMQQRLEGFKAEVNQAKAKAAELEAENTRLRQMLKAGTVAAELKAMHDHIGEMMRRMHTADIVALPEKENAEVISLRQASA